MTTLELLNRHIPCWTIAHTWLGADVFHPGCSCGWSGVPCSTDNEVLDQHQAHLAREIDQRRPVGDAAQIKSGAIDGIRICSPSRTGELGVLQADDSTDDCDQDAIEVGGPTDLINHRGADGQLDYELRIVAGDRASVAERDGKRLDGESTAFHDDSSTGDGPAATGHTDSVEVTARRGDDSGPGEHGGLWSAAAHLFGRGEQR